MLFSSCFFDIVIHIKTLKYCIFKHASGNANCFPGFTVYVCRCGCYPKLTNYGTRIMYMEYVACVGTISLFQIAIEVVNSNSGL